MVNLLRYKKEDDQHYKRFVRNLIDLVNGVVSSPRIVLVGTYADSNADITAKATEIRDNFQQHEATVFEYYNGLIASMKTTKRCPDTLWTATNLDKTSVIVVRPTRKARTEDASSLQREKRRSRYKSVMRRFSVRNTQQEEEDPDTPLAIVSSAQKLRPVLLNNRVYFVSNTEYSGMPNLRTEIGTILNEPSSRTAQKLPSLYVYFAEYLEELGLADPLIPIEVGRNSGQEERLNLKFIFVGSNRLFSSIGEMKAALADLHNLGFVLWYDNDDHLQNWVFLSRQWVSELIRSVIRHDMFSTVLPALGTKGQFVKEKQRFKGDAVLNAKLLYRFEKWVDTTLEQRRLLILLLKQLDLLAFMPEAATEKGAEPQVEYLIPFYLQRRLRESAKITEERSLPAVPKQLARLFTKDRLTNDDMPDSKLKERHVQYMYLFENCNPHGALQRLLARITQYVEVDYSSLTPCGAKVTDPAGNEFIMEQHLGFHTWNQKRISGAVLITGIRSDTWNTFWNTMVLFQVEFEDLLTKSYPGVFAGVFIGMIQFRKGKSNRLIIARRSELEEFQLTSLKEKDGESTDELFFDVDKNFQASLQHFLPELCERVSKPVLSESQREVFGNFAVFEEEGSTFTEPASLFPIDKPMRLQRKSYYGEIQAILANFQAQMNCEATFRQTRLKLIHRHLLRVVLSLLKQLTIAKGGDAFGDIHSYLDFLANKSMTGFQNWAAVIQTYHAVSKNLFVDNTKEIYKMGVENVITACQGLLFSLRLIMKDKQPERPVIKCL